MPVKNYCSVVFYKGLDQFVLSSSVIDSDVKQEFV